MDSPVVLFSLLRGQYVAGDEDYLLPVFTPSFSRAKRFSGDRAKHLQEKHSHFRYEIYPTIPYAEMSIAIVPDKSEEPTFKIAKKRGAKR